MRGEGEGSEENSSPLSLPLPFFFFFCSRSNFRAITRLESLATQAKVALNLLADKHLLIIILISQKISPGQSEAENSINASVSSLVIAHILLFKILT